MQGNNNENEDESSDDDNQSTRSNRSTGSNRSRGQDWGAQGFQQVTMKSGHSHVASPTLNLRDYILIDTGSTVDTMMNPDFVTDIKASKNKLAMSTNAGVKEITLRANMKGYGNVWYDTNQIANIFSFGRPADKYKVKYNSEKEDAFVVDTGKQVM